MCRDSIIMVEVQAYTLTCKTETKGGIHYGEVYHMYLYRYQAKMILGFCLEWILNFKVSCMI